jgi:hypothetical protein
MLTISADNKSKTLGTANPPLTATFSGFVDSNDSGSVSGVPMLTTTANQSSPIGNYPINVAAGSLNVTNYNFTFLPGTLSVMPPPNTAPVLPVQADRQLQDLTTLRVVNTASDSDIPANNLIYQFLAAPDGANLSSQGVITWTPTLAQSPTTNTFTTVVTDDGVPPLSATNSFVVVVTGPYDGIDLRDPIQAANDLDGDGIPNLVEYALGTDPRKPTGSENAMVTSFIENNSSQYLSIQFRRRRSSPGVPLQYLLEVSGDRQTWFSDSTHVQVISVTPLDEQFESVTMRDQTPLEATTPRFIRLRVIEN